MRSNKKMRKSKKPDTGELRIIGGQWKRTKLTFPLLEGVRPTPSRVRETVFNWLTTDIRDSICIDLFAGSGALGFEALSRGAKKVIFVDMAPLVCESIIGHANKLNANAQIVLTDAMNIQALQSQILDRPDIIFCDPPFNKGAVPTLLQALASSDWLNKPAYIYVETEAALTTLDTPSDWELLREKKAGDVVYRLFLSA